MSTISNEIKKLTEAVSKEGSSPVSIETLSVVSNGEYNAPSGKAYNQVNVDVKPRWVELHTGRVGNDLEEEGAINEHLTIDYPFTVCSVFKFVMDNGWVIYAGLHGPSITPDMPGTSVCVCTYEGDFTWWVRPDHWESVFTIYATLDVTVNAPDDWEYPNVENLGVNLYEAPMEQPELLSTYILYVLEE